MKHILNDLSESEKNRILSQYNNSLSVDTSKFKKLLESKLGNVKPLLTEDDSSTPFGNFKCVTNTIDIGSKLWPKKSEHHPGKYYMREFRDSSGRSQYTMTSGGMKIVYYDSGAYYIEKSDGSLQPSGKKDFYRYYCQGDTIKRTTEIVTIDGPPKPPPFKDNTEGNKFRKWVNQNYPKIAKDPSVDLSETGVQADSYKNSYITKAWNYKVGDKTLGELYTQSSLPGMDWMGDMFKDKSGTDPVSKGVSKVSTGERTWGEFFSEELFGSSNKERLAKRDDILKAQIMDPKFKAIQTLKGADRINRELVFINSRPEYDGKPFFILDYYLNLVVAFNEKHEMVAWSYSVAGADKQPEKVVGSLTWCEMSAKHYNNIGYGFVNLNSEPKREGYKQNFDNKKIPAGFVPPYNLEKKVGDPSIPNPDIPKVYDNKYGFHYVQCYDKNGRRFAQSYDSPAIIKSQAKGIYGGAEIQPGGYLYDKEGKTTPDQISLRNLFGTENQPQTAIHYTVQVQNRVSGMEKLGQLVSPEGITPEYEKAVRTRPGEFDLSAGCFNVTKEFITNPEVVRISKMKPYIFLMGDSDKNYLVQAEPSEYFNNLSKDGMCRNPEAVANEIGEKIPKGDRMG